ncbi:MAG: hypothetical protein AAGK97_05875 [Bacteroidota bacterium]
MKFNNTCDETIIREIESLKAFFLNGNSLKNCTLQNIDFSQSVFDWDKVEISNTTFLGCKMDVATQIKLIEKSAIVIPQPKNLPYNPFRAELYNWEEMLKENGNGQSIDLDIYEHFSCSKFNPSINEALWQRIHDHAMDDGLRDLIQTDAKGVHSKKIVGFMGGHSVLRTDPFYKIVARTAQLLSSNGYFIASGGGPGIMEACNLGAYFGAHNSEDLEDALITISKAPHYSDKGFTELAVKVLKQYPNGNGSIAIPTWFYGHEPSNVFATHIAKYFSNSIREDTLLAICSHGIVFAPGSAGTTQEIFMDAAQNHYGTFNFYSPMVFLGTERYTKQTKIYDLLLELAEGRTYKKFIHLTDEPKEVFDFIERNPPQEV